MNITSKLLIKQFFSDNLLLNFKWETEMAKFLDTAGISYYLQRVIEDAKKFLILVSPYLKMNARIRELLFEKDRVGIKIYIIYGKKALNPLEKTWLQSLKNTRIKFCKNLHAKCYINEGTAIVTSMNLYDFSEINNKEMGILIVKSSDRSLYSDTSKEVRRLLENSDEVTPEESAVEEKTDEESKKLEVPEKPKKFNKNIPMGFCIACDKELPLNLRKPYCLPCYRERNFRKQTYIEGFCHVCGSEYKTSLAKPLCNNCYKKL